MHSYIIYTDGAYSSSRDKGGVAFIIVEDNKEIFSYSKMFKSSTNQRMEQLAAIIALESIKEPSDVTIVSDSQYVVSTYNKNWKRKANVDLWDRFDKAISKHNSVKFEWTKGHAGNEFNNKCDKLAYNASQELG